MNHQLFSVYDTKAEVYTPPFFVPTLGIATRAFSDCVNSADHQFGKHPQDYTLFKLGTFDDNTAHLELLPAPQSIGNGLEYLDKSTSESPDVTQQPPIQSD